MDVTGGAIGGLMQHMPYVGLFTVLFIAGLGLPLPEDVPLLIAGWLVHKGKADLFWMIAVGMIGVLSGDFLLYTWGRRYGTAITEHRFIRRITSPALLARAENLFERHGAKIIFAARFMPGLRAVMFMTAGIFRVRPLKFVLIDGSAAAASVPLLIWLGERFGAKFEELTKDVRNAGAVLGVIVAVVVVALIAWEYYHTKRRKRLDALLQQGLLKPIEPPASERAARPSAGDRPGARNPSGALGVGRAKGTA